MTDDDVKTRGQKEKLEQITSEPNGEGEHAPNDDKPAPNGDHSEPNGDKPAPNGDNNEPNGEKAPNGEEDAPKPKVPREGTMVVTAKVK